MTIVTLVCVLTAMAVGLRFKVLVLVPVIAIGILATGTMMIARGDHTWAILGAVLLNGVGMQVGYLCGTFAYSMLRDQRAHEPAMAISAGGVENFNAPVGVNIPGQFAD
jgi:hypothetical protein